MKSKIGIIMIALCVLSYIFFEKAEKKKDTTKTERFIYGKIVDATNNSPIKDVSIAIQGQNPKSKSNADGEFTILVNTDKELVFRHKEYKTKELPAMETDIVKMEVSDTKPID